MPTELEDQIRRGKNEDIYRSRVTNGALDPRTMKTAEIVTEIRALRETMSLAAQRIVHLAQSLYTHARRDASTDTATPAYYAFSTTWGRFGGAIQQGLKRTMVADRVLEQALGSQAEEQRRFEAREDSRRKQAEEKQRPRPEQPNPLRNKNPLRTLEGESLDDLMQLYGSEILRDARR